MPDSRALAGLGIPAQVADILGDVPTVTAGTGTTQAAAAPLISNCTSINGQTGQTAVYLITATAASFPDRILWSPYYLNYSTLSNASPIIFVGVGGYMNGVLNGSITLASGQAAIAWQQAPGLYYSVKTT